MTANILSLAARLFDAIEGLFESTSSQKRIAKVFLWTYLLALATVECRLRGLVPEGLARFTPTSHFAAVQLAFTLILAMEILELILTIPNSFAQSSANRNTRRISSACREGRPAYPRDRWTYTIFSRSPAAFTASRTAG